MKLYIGGACQGQEELARRENPGAQMLPQFHMTIRALLEAGEDISDFVQNLCETMPDCIIISDEIGSGIVPIDPLDRSWREAVGRALCMIAGHSETVTRVICGIGVRIK